MRRAILAVLLVCSVVGPAVAGGVGATAAISDRPAQLVVQQPHYIDGDVTVTRANGTRIYKTAGPVQTLFPQNFEAGRVVDFGVTTDGGEMAYNPQVGSFTMSADSAGTYSVYWVVAEPTRRTANTSQNGTANATNTTTVTTTTQVRYTARIRVTGQTSLTHMSQESLSETRRKARLWEDANATIQELRRNNLWVSLGLQPPLSTEQTFQEMVNAYRLKNSPLKALTGDTLKYIVLLLMGLGGIVLLVTFAAWHFGVVAWLTRKINRFQAIEKDEGDWARRVEEQELADREVALVNQSHNSIYGDGFIASAMREEGRNPVQSFANFWRRNSERGRFKHRLQVMGQHGYVGVPAEGTAPDARTDGGVTDTQHLDEVTIAHTDEVAEGVATIPLDAAHVDDDFIDAISDWSDPTIQSFDLASADWDPDKIDVGEPAADVPESLADFLSQMHADRRHFADDEAPGKYLLDLLNHVRRSGLTTDTGDVDGIRYWLEQQLDTAHVLNDRFEIPVDYHIEALEAAIRNHDRREEAQQRRQEVKDGKHA